MHSTKLVFFVSISLILLNGLFISVLASDSEQDIKSARANVSIIAEDVNNIYAAGARVSIEGKVKENIWVAGALVDVDTEIDGDLYAAGSKVSVKGIVTGKARVAGADLNIDAEIIEVLNAAAASIEVSDNTKLPSNSSLAAALIEFDGTAEDNLSLYADEVVFTGQASGSVTIEARNVNLDETARIEGDLTIRSSEKAVISPNATIVGKLTQTSLEDSEFFKAHEDNSDDLGFFFLLATSVFLLGLILVIFARGFVEQGITMLRTQPGKSILWGLVVFFSIPIFVLITMVTIVGIPIGVAALLLLPFLLILGFTMATLGVSDWILNRKSESKQTSQRLLFLAAGVIILVIVGFLPFVGGLLILLAMLLGLGAAAVTLGSHLSGTSTEVV